MVVLIVDDDKDDTEIFCNAVRSIDLTIHCVVADSGQQAITLLQAGLIPDFVFLDIRMTGKEVLVDLRKNATRHSTRVIMYSSTFNLAEVAGYREIGCDQFLIKAPGFQQLCDGLQLVFGIGAR